MVTKVGAGVDGPKDQAYFWTPEWQVEERASEEDIAKGLAAFLNSTTLDEHFRVFSGHTQVNATDFRNMRYPSREQLRKLGLLAKNQPNDQATIDRMLEELETP